MNFINNNYSAKINDIESKITCITSLATTTALNAIKNKIPNVTDVVKKTNYDAKIKNIDGKYLTIADYSKFKSELIQRKNKMN